MSETRRDRAIFAARLRALPGKDKVILTTDAIDDICAEYLEAHETLMVAEQLCRKAVLKEREECADDAESLDHVSYNAATEIAGIIRARGES